MNQLQQRPGFLVTGARPRGFVPHQPHKRGVALARAQVLFGHAKTPQIFGGQIHAAAIGVFADVPQNVGQLEGDAARFGQRQGGGRVEAKDVNGGQPHHRGHLIAIEPELVERLEATGLQVRDHAIDHGAEIVVRDAEAANRVMERRPDGMPAEAALERLLEFPPPALEGRARGARLVAQIVAVAHEGIDSAHGFALLRGEQQEGVVEILGAGARHAAAVLVGLLDRVHGAARRKAVRASEPSSSRTRSAFEMTGLAARTS